MFFFFFFFFCDLELWIYGVGMILKFDTLGDMGFSVVWVLMELVNLV